MSHNESADVCVRIMSICCVARKSENVASHPTADSKDSMPESLDRLLNAMGPIGWLLRPGWAILELCMLFTVICTRVEPHHKSRKCHELEMPPFPINAYVSLYAGFGFGLILFINIALLFLLAVLVFLMSHGLWLIHMSVLTFLTSGLIFSVNWSVACSCAVLNFSCSSRAYAHTLTQHFSTTLPCSVSYSHPANNGTLRHTRTTLTAFTLPTLAPEVHWYSASSLDFHTHHIASQSHAHTRPARRMYIATSKAEAAAAAVNESKTQINKKKSE